MAVVCATHEFTFMHAALCTYASTYEYVCIYGCCCCCTIHMQTPPSARSTSCTHQYHQQSRKRSIHVHMYVRMNAHLFKYIHTYIYPSISAGANPYVPTRICISHMYTYTYVCIFMYICIYILAIMCSREKVLRSQVARITSTPLRLVLHCDWWYIALLLALAIGARNSL